VDRHGHGAPIAFAHEHRMLPVALDHESDPQYRPDEALPRDIPRKLRQTATRRLVTTGAASRGIAQPRALRAST
jgi:hypothetical protein